LIFSGIPLAAGAAIHAAGRAPDRWAALVALAIAGVEEVALSLVLLMMVLSA
jgi:hypothetical protein